MNALSRRSARLFLAAIITLAVISAPAAPAAEPADARALVKTVADAVLRDFPQPPPFNWGAGVTPRSSRIPSSLNGVPEM